MSEQTHREAETAAAFAESLPWSRVEIEKVLDGVDNFSSMGEKIYHVRVNLNHIQECLLNPRIVALLQDVSAYEELVARSNSFIEANS